MEHYVTLFDRAFLPQGLALHASLERHAAPYTLWVLGLDKSTCDVLSALHGPNLRVIALDGVETPELASVKGGRTRAEYCWTLTPFAPRFVFEADPSVQRVTYVDADLWFRKSPAPIFRELQSAGKHVLITDHAYAPEHDQSAISGQYCVQFVTFDRAAGEHVRKWWEVRCIEWCYARVEGGKFGDQKYLDDWPERFADAVHVLERSESILAPWNATRFPYGCAVAYHFHGLRLMANGRVLLTDDYALPDATVKHVYGPYLEDLRGAVRALRAAGLEPTPQAGPAPYGRRLKSVIEGSYRSLWRLRTRRVVTLGAGK